MWKVDSEDIELARHQIASKRLRLDDILSATQGVQFYFSCVTSVMCNAKSSQSVPAEGSASKESYPAIAFFIVYKKCDTCNESTLFSALHNEDMEPEITAIRVRAQLASYSNKEMETAARQLFNVVKDHNNGTIQEMLDVSNVYCFRNAQESSSDSDEEELDDLLHSQSTRFPLLPCCLFVVNLQEFGDQLTSAIENLRSDGLVVEMGAGHGVNLDNSCFASDSDLATTIHQIEKVMTICHHAIYRSDVYAKPDEASVTFVRMTDVASYLHRLLGNESLRDNMLRHFASIQKFLSHPACEIIQQIKFDLDLIEVANGYCFSIKTRSFIPCPIPSSKLGKLSPRAFVPYDHTTPPNPQYFREAILNSFPDDDERAKFLNKFYQCLSAFNMPHKVKKLVVAGPKDSGKTSWSNIFHRIIPSAAIASLTKEKQFSAAMITNDTQLVIVDEWSASTMESDLAKSILQGGWMVTAVKHGVPRTVLNNSPYYITTNHVPDFGDEDENVRRRIDIFTTESLPRPRPGINRWLYDHAMDCIAWIADEINGNRDVISDTELWYEGSNSEPLTIAANEGELLFDNARLRAISEADLRPENVDEPNPPVIHDTFATEFQVQQMRRKRRKARQTPVIESDSSDADIEVPANICTAATSSPSSLQQPLPNLVDDEHPVDPEELLPQPHNQGDGCSNDDVDEQFQDARDQWKSSGQTLSPPSEFNVHTPPSGWTLNDESYLARVASLIKYGLINSVSKAHVHSFLERLRKAELQKTHADKQFFTTADPWIDAWMLLTGRKRDVFDVSSFVNNHPDILPHLQSLRPAANILVLTSRCPVARELERQRRQTEGESSNSQQREEVPSQSYWTVVKRWVPW